MLCRDYSICRYDYGRDIACSPLATECDTPSGIAACSMEIGYILLYSRIRRPLLLTDDSTHEMECQRVSPHTERVTLRGGASFRNGYILASCIERRTRDPVNNAPDFLLDRYPWMGDQIMDQPVSRVWIILIGI